MEKNLAKQLQEKMREKESKANNEQTFKEKIQKDTGINIDETLLKDFNEEKMDEIFGECWGGVLRHAKENKLKMKNLVAITGKDTRKTTVFIIFMWWLMNKYKFLNAFVLRDTLLKSQSQMRMQVIKGANLIQDEYGISGFNETIYQTNDGIYFLRDRNSKRNQKIEMLSFDSIIELGGFTTSNGKSAIFIYDELQNPNSINKEVLTKEQFLANYKFIDSKNEGIEISTGEKLPDYIPRHYFLSNRYIGNYPLNIFAEAHFPFYDEELENGKTQEGVKSWMLKDPMNNNFVGKFVGEGEAKEGWEDFENTMIIYASKLSNQILLANKEWKEKQLKLIEKGNKEDLAVIIGDLFEGYVSARNTYFYSKISEISEEEFIKTHAKGINKVFLALDLDFSRQIVMGAKYYYGEGKEFKIFRDKFTILKCNGVSSDGAKTEKYLHQTWEAILRYCLRIKQMMPQIQQVQLLIDDKKAQWVGRFNQGQYANNFYKASKITFDQEWKITKRPKDIDMLQDTGTIIDIKHPSIDKLHRYMKESYAEPKSGNDTKIIFKRIEKANDERIDIINVDEYGAYFAIGRARIKNKGV